MEFILFYITKTCCGWGDFSGVVDIIAAEAAMSLSADVSRDSIVCGEGGDFGMGWIRLEGDCV